MSGGKMRKYLVVAMVMSLCVLSFAADKNADAKTLAAPAAASASSSDDAMLQAMASETGLSKSIINSLTAKIKIDEVLMAYCISLFTGNSVTSIVEKYGNNFVKYYADYHVDADYQANIQNKYTALSAKLIKQDVQTSTYAGVDQDKAAMLIEQYTGVSRYDVKYYGFKSGIAENDILQAAEFRQASGNRFADIIDAKKHGSWMDVWQKYGVNEIVQATITTKTSTDSPTVFPAAAAAKTKPASVTPNMTKCADVLAEQLGIDRYRTMQYLNDGEPIADVVQAFVISSKSGNDVYNIFKLKDEGGWAKVYSNYSIGVTKLAEITDVCSTITAKITPPAQ